MNKIAAFLKRGSFFFIIINIVVAGLGFVRSFAFMKFLGFEELGIITMVTTVASMLGFFQIGLINGGYRIVALKEEKAIEKTNNTIISFLLLVSVMVSVITILLVIFRVVDYQIAFVSIAIGILMLFNNWFTNRLIGSGNLPKVNLANMWGAIISLFGLVLVYYYGFIGALICLFSQPLVFMIVAYDKSFAFTKLEIDVKHIKYILSFGFIPFVSGIFFLAYMQIERWGISTLLGNAELGKMYLFFVIVTLWTLIPTSVLNILYPKAIKFYSDKDIIQFRKSIRDNFWIVVGYNLVATMAVFVLLYPVVELFFSNHLSNVYLVYLSVPGLVMRQMADPLALFFNSVVCLKPLFWSDLFSLAIYLLTMVVFLFTDSIQLDTFVIGFNIYFFSKLIILFIYYAKVKKHY